MNSSWYIRGKGVFFSNDEEKDEEYDEDEN